MKKLKQIKMNKMKKKLNEINKILENLKIINYIINKKEDERNKSLLE